MNTYDPESGQVFAETIMPSKRYEASWEFRCRGNNPDRKSRLIAPPTPQRRGTKTLQDLCMAKLICNANNLLPETLENLPEPVALRIWTAIRREWRESFHVWTAFINAGFSERTLKHVLVFQDWEIKFTLMDIFNKISSPRCAWVVDLTLANVRLSAAEFKEVSRIRNLRNLVVHYGRSADGWYFDDRIVQAWSNRARDGDAFGHLETLSVVNAPAITSRVFAHLSGFPALTAFLSVGGVQYRKRDFQEAERHGWARLKPDNNSNGTAYWSHWRNPSQLERTWRMVGPHVVRDLVESQRSNASTSKLAVPQLDAQLGDPGAKVELAAPNDYLIFKRDMTFVPQQAAGEVDEHTQSHKRRKMNDARGADFATMLNGGG